jgi:hypothetical protein
MPYSRGQFASPAIFGVDQKPCRGPGALVPALTERCPVFGSTPRPPRVPCSAVIMMPRVSQAHREADARFASLKRVRPRVPRPCLSVPRAQQGSRCPASSLPRAPRCPGTGTSAQAAPLTTTARGESLLTHIGLFALGTAHPCGGLAKCRCRPAPESSLLMPLLPAFTAAVPPPRLGAGPAVRPHRRVVGGTPRRGREAGRSESTREPSISSSTSPPLPSSSRCQRRAGPALQRWGGGRPHLVPRGSYEVLLCHLPQC